MDVLLCASSAATWWPTQGVEQLLSMVVSSQIVNMPVVVMCRFAELQQHIDELTQEKYELLRALGKQRQVTEQLSAENQGLTDDFNRQVGLQRIIHVWLPPRSGVRFDVGCHLSALGTFCKCIGGVEGLICMSVGVAHQAPHRFCVSPREVGPFMFKRMGCPMTRSSYSG